MNGLLTLWWGDPALAGWYRADLLHGADRPRAETARSARAELDWRVSRAVLQQALAAGAGADAAGHAHVEAASRAAPEAAGFAMSAAPAVSISHSRGHALVATAPAGWRIGVDLEAIRPRDTARLAPWCCAEDEARALASCETDAERLRAFYALWTIKESFVKAAGLAFPADMRTVGLAGAGRPWTGWRLRAPGVGWSAWSAVIDDVWLASVVWRRSDAPVQPALTAPPDAPLWRTARGAAEPRIVPAGRWP
ncbi:4'-phosphopantetheinyl transferase domain-containing protein [Bordetella sputigena]|uniref:4'-phosphopantetheinyl transferase family protein n=1 Tax=Bordetella sputigena TaxID=1416810 RepID=UPI0039F0F845